MYATAVPYVVSRVPERVSEKVHAVGRTKGSAKLSATYRKRMVGDTVALLKNVLHVRVRTLQIHRIGGFAVEIAFPRDFAVGLFAPVTIRPLVCVLRIRIAAVFWAGRGAWMIVDRRNGIVSLGLGASLVPRVTQVDKI